MAQFLAPAATPNTTGPIIYETVSIQALTPFGAFIYETAAGVPGAGGVPKTTRMTLMGVG